MKAVILWLFGIGMALIWIGALIDKKSSDPMGNGGVIFSTAGMVGVGISIVLFAVGLLRAAWSHL